MEILLDKLHQYNKTSLVGHFNYFDHFTNTYNIRVIVPEHYNKGLWGKGIGLHVE